MAEQTKGKKIYIGRGGKRKGAGRPPKDEPMKLYTFRATGDIVRHLDSQKQRSEYIKRCIINDMQSEREPDFSSLGKVYPATQINDVHMPLFDIKIVAGFPIPLDNDERAQNIELIKMLCPHPEASYLIRVIGDSMIDANIHSGDIVIVDKSNRNPSEKEVAVCELNGEYTLKYFVQRGDEGWLVPANPAYPEFHITEADDFSIWGTVTYIIHRPSPHSTSPRGGEI